MLESFCRSISFCPCVRLHYMKIRDHEFMQRFKWDAIVTCSFPPPFTPTQLNPEFAKLCLQDTVIKQSTLEGRHIQGFNANFDDLHQSEKDLVVQRKIQLWLQAYSHQFTGYATVRGGMIYCRIDGCTAQFSLNTSNFYKHFHRRHEITSSNNDTGESSAKKPKIN